MSHILNGDFADHACVLCVGVCVRVCVCLCVLLRLRS